MLFFFGSRLEGGGGIGRDSKVSGIGVHDAKFTKNQSFLMKLQMKEKHTEIVFLNSLVIIISSFISLLDNTDCG